MRGLPSMVLAATAVVWLAAAASAEIGELKVEIQQPPAPWAW